MDTYEDIDRSKKRKPNRCKTVEFQVSLLLYTALKDRPLKKTVHLLIVTEYFIFALRIIRYAPKTNDTVTATSRDTLSVY